MITNFGQATEPLNNYDKNGVQLIIQIQLLVFLNYRHIIEKHS